MSTRSNTPISNETDEAGPFQDQQNLNVNVALKTSALPPEIQHVLTSMTDELKNLESKLSDNMKKKLHTECSELHRNLNLVKDYFTSQQLELQHYKTHPKASIQDTVQLAVQEVLTTALRETRTEMQELKNTVSSLQEEITAHPTLPQAYKSIRPYSTVVAAPVPKEVKNIQPKETAAPILVVKSKSTDVDSGAIRDKIRIIADKSNTPIRPDNILLTKFSRIVLTFQTRLEAEDFQKAIMPNVDTNQLEVILPKVQWKSIVLLGVPEKQSKEAVTNRLLHVLEEQPEHLEITYTTRPINKFVNHIVELDEVTYVRLLRRKRVFIDFSSVRIDPNFKIMRCKNCRQFGHTASRCSNPKHCIYCAKHHDKESCDATSPCCINCYQTQNNSNHAAFSPLCPIYKKLKDAFIKQETDYVNDYNMHGLAPLY